MKIRPSTWIFFDVFLLLFFLSNFCNEICKPTTYVYKQPYSKENVIYKENTKLKWDLEFK